jgi:hypothetical protein
MKNKKIEYSIIAVSLVMMTSISVVDVMKDKKQERIEKEEKIQYQIMLNENSLSVEDYKEKEKMYEQEKIEWEEKVRYEIVNNPNFEEDFNKLQEIENGILNLNNGILYSYYDDHETERKEYVQTLFDEIELEENSVLNDLRDIMILNYKWGNSDAYTKQNDLEDIIRNYI